MWLSFAGRTPVAPAEIPKKFSLLETEDQAERLVDRT
jgi:hypothetical protein